MPRLIVLTQVTVAQVIGAARLQRLLRAHWLIPLPRIGKEVLYAAKDLHAAIRRLERGDLLPPDRDEVRRIRASEQKHGKGYVRRPKEPSIFDLDEIHFD